MNNPHKIEQKKEILNTHLSGSLKVEGSCVIFLHPDSLRFATYEKNEEEGIYEVDSDFGFGISATMDTIAKNKKYENIKSFSTDKRYILIYNSKNAPVKLDRDTLDYGVIFTMKDKDMEIIKSVHSGDYLGEVDNYFKSKK